MSRRRTYRRKKNKLNLKLDLSDRVTHEISAIVYACLALVTILSIQGLSGPIGDIFRDYMQLTFGRGIWFFPIGLIALSTSLFLSHKVNIHLTKLVGMFLSLGAILGLIHMQTPFFNQLENVSQYGGYLGFTSSFILRYFLEDLATTVILGTLFLIGVVIVFEISIRELISLINPFNLIRFRLKISKTKSKQGGVKVVKPSTNDDLNNQAPIEEKIKKTLQAVDEAYRGKKPQIKSPSNNNKNTEFKVQHNDSPDWEPPSLNLLDSESSKLKIDERILVKKAEMIKNKFQKFSIDVTMKDIHVGPTVTQFTLQPHEGIKLNKITALKNDLALTLAAKSIRIEAPIPGKSLVGIEIPNENRMIVHLKEILKSEEFKAIKSSLRLPIGRDVSGKPIIYDLAKMPHLLIAGRTGSGKSVCMNTTLLSLLYQNSPKQLKFIMIDPKRVELMPFNGIPHLLTSVITDIDKAISALRWATAEMSRRYNELSEKGYRNIGEYNDEEKEKMYKIVIIIDELADIMMRSNRKEAETLICRLAQMARAVGIHLIIATQRPSVDIITGVIKANIPSRLAFAVASGVDSRTILDGIGAEDLLGLGDMLMLSNENSGLQRIQGILVSKKEIEKVTNKIKLTHEKEYTTPIIFGQSNIDDKIPLTSSGFGDQFNLDTFADVEDEKFQEAIAVVKRTGKASATLLQRHLSIGYARAAKLLDIMEEKEMIAPADGAKARKIYFLEKEEVK